MKIFLIIIMILDCIYPCVLRKKRHCLEKDLLKDRMHPDTCIEIEEFIQSSEPKKSRLLESNYFLGHPLYYYSTNESSTDQRVSTNSNIEHVLLNPDNLPLSNLEIVVPDKTSITDQIENSFNDIKNYMERLLTDIQLIHYLKRLENLKTSYKFIIDNEGLFKKSDLIFKPFDHKFIEVLDKLLANFTPEATFNQLVFENFKKDLHGAIFSDKDLRFLNGQIRIKFNFNMKLLFYVELTKCAKHFGLIPELMVLGGTFAGRSIDFIVILIHSINLLIEKRKDSPLLKNFVVCMIKRAVECSKRSAFDLFSINKLETDCRENQNDLYFFIWEMNNSKRKDYKCKCFENEVFHYTTIDKLHFRTVLLIFIYQRITLLKLKNAGNEEIERYLSLIKRVINDSKCPDCDYDEFLKIIQKSE
ncbi:hypothetical protein NBO_78g0008 [Nosema bombycis CQ1]|uniref:Uncharacterized protein n=1 Tax=Nosema bombycis (strain CQ1 / CVCC 102059) TaxID=578461 RepID=R0KRK8_NOSB1|nr:hypothetical protein NBO_78g0008 [Nosema bombycis CQ1]|eukprot:EOB13381.1 hypothetical protein NBO_78g0008 [Nosema bombycis CQ1]